MRRSIAVFALFACAFVPLQTAAAQSGEELLQEGRLAFREGRYEDAVRHFERAASADSALAEAHYLLSRVYFETPLRNERRARKELERALELEPNNLQFLVARLQQLRTETTNFFAERIQEVRRRELARHILALDSTNAFAHEELGITYIQDFWRYRNAFMMPTLRFAQPTVRPFEEPERRGDEFVAMVSDEQKDEGLPGGGTELQLDPFDETLDLPEFDPNEIFLADRFDFDRIEKLGVPVQDLSARAARAYDRAIGHLNQAIRSDPRRRPVYDRLMQIYALKGDYEAAVETLQEMYTFFPEDAQTWLYLGLAHYRLGNLDAASKSFETAEVYMTDAEKTAYASLDFLLPAEERDAYQEDPIAYASRFWTSKDPLFLTTYNERKLEHHARLVYADLLYGSDDLNLRGWETERGRILVRYGPPKVDVVFIPRTNAPQAVRHNRQDAGGAQTSSFDMAAEANLFNIWDYGDFRFVFEDPFRNGAYRIYSPTAAEISEGIDPWIHDYAIKARETFRRIPERYEYVAPGRQVELPYLITAFKGQGPQTDLYVHYGVPITTYDPAVEQLDITANVGTFVVNDAHDLLVERRRTLYGLRTAHIVRFDGGNLWVDTQEMQAPPGEHEVSVEFETASGGTVAVQRRGITVPDFTQDRLALSDMLLAYRVEEAEPGGTVPTTDIVRNGLSIMPAPWSVFSTKQPIYLYFEFYNLEAGADGKTGYEVEITLRPRETRKGLGRLVGGLAGGRKGVSVRYDGSGTLADEGQYQILDATDQEPGLYTLTLKVHDRIAKRTVQTEQDLFLE